MRRSRLTGVAAAVAVVIRCVLSAVGPHTGASTTAAPALTDLALCDGSFGFSCGTLTVPLDHDHRVPGTPGPRITDYAHEPRDLLLALIGGSDGHVR